MGQHLKPFRMRNMNLPKCLQTFNSTRCPLTHTDEWYPVLGCFDASDIVVETLQLDRLTLTVKNYENQINIRSFLFCLSPISYLSFTFYDKALEKTYSYYWEMVKCDVHFWLAQFFNFWNRITDKPCCWRRSELSNTFFEMFWSHGGFFSDGMSVLQRWIKACRCQQNDRPCDHWRRFLPSCQRRNPVKFTESWNPPIFSQRSRSHQIKHWTRSTFSHRVITMGHDAVLDKCRPVKWALIVDRFIQ